MYTHTLTHTHTHNTVCFFIDWSLMETSRLHAAVRKVPNSVTYLITLSSVSLSYYKFSLELFDRTAYEYANSFAPDAVPCFLINLHVVRFFPPAVHFQVVLFRYFCTTSCTFLEVFLEAAQLQSVARYCSLHASVQGLSSLDHALVVLMFKSCNQG